ncbi:diphosphate--fructose-6-phosphate 1-phosphotransferase [bacterium]|nr:diphosphate--fructose-6-phosphate 1-phosphotransferase [bacterium]
MLEDQLQKSEGQQSLFENKRRTIPQLVLPSFGSAQNLQYQPLTSQSKRIETPYEKELKKKFEKTFSTQVLEPVEGNTQASTPKPKGKRIAVLFSGGPASGGHNVVAGLLQMLGEHNTLLGVLNGPKGLLKGTFIEITIGEIDRIQNQGGFNLLGSDRTKIKTREQLKQVKDMVIYYNLDGIVIIGGDDSNTNAAIMAEYLADINCSVVGVSKTIDGDVQVEDYLPISFGFDTATKIYSETVGNILQDAASSRKYWHFIKLMGRHASHVTIEVSLQTHPPLTFISEAVQSKKMTWSDIVDATCDAVVTRYNKGMSYGAVLLPEGLVEHLADGDAIWDHFEDSVGFDSHGNRKLSQIETEKVLMKHVQVRLTQTHPEIPFEGITHFLGYEGRCAAPTQFDAFFTFNLGVLAGTLVLQGATGMMGVIGNWDEGGRVAAVPLTALLTQEERSGQTEWVLKKQCVNLKSGAYTYWESRQKDWLESDAFNSPGPRQYEGESANQLPILVALNQGYQSLKFN